MTALAYPPYDPGMDRFSGWVYLAVFILLAAAAWIVTDVPSPRRLLALVPYENWRIVCWWWYRQYKRADRKAFRAECAAIRLRAPVAEEEGPALPASGPDPAPEPWQVPVPRGRHAARADLLTVTWDETRGMYL